MRASPVLEALSMTRLSLVSIVFTDPKLLRPSSLSLLVKYPVLTGHLCHSSGQSRGATCEGIV